MDWRELLTKGKDWGMDHGLRILLILAVAYVVWIVARILATKAFALFQRDTLDEETNQLGDKLRSVIRWILRVMIFGIATMMVLKEGGFDVGPMIASAGVWVLDHGIKIVLILVSAYVASILARILSTKAFSLLKRDRLDVETQKRADTLGSVVRWVLRVVIFIIATMMLMKEVGFDIGPIIAAAGVVGLAVGFGAQNLVADVISGFFILLEDQVRVGDVVELGGKGGLVEKVTLRMIILRDLAGNVHYIRNGKVDVVTNMTKEYSRYVFEIGVAYREDVDEVIKVVKTLDEELRADPDFKDAILQPIEVLGLDKFADSAVVIKARTTTKPIQQWRVGREFNRRLKKRFDELGIEIPYPHVTFYVGRDKKGEAAPLGVKLEGEGRTP